MSNPQPGREAAARIPALGRIGSWVLTVVAAGLLLASLKLPLWQMRLEAPQYQGKEALHVAVLPNTLRGDLRELGVLDQYIGVHVPRTLPQFKWLPWVLLAAAGLGLAANALRGKWRSRALGFVAMGLAAALGLAAAQARSQIYRIGHQRAAHSPLAGIQDFTPPFLGTTKIAQFEVNSRFGLGAWLVGAALVMQLGAACYRRPRRGDPPPVCGYELDTCNQSGAGQVACHPTSL